MATTFLRRAFLKKTALLTGGLVSLPTLFNQVQAAPAFTGSIDAGHLSDEAAFETTPPDMVARLLANENPFGPSAKAKKAMAESIDLSYQYAIKNVKELEKVITE